MKRALSALTLSLALLGCGGDFDDPQPTARVWTGKNDGKPFDGIMSFVGDGSQTLYVECPLGQLCGVDITNWWLAGVELPRQDDAARYGIGVTTRAEAPGGPKEDSSFAGLGDLGTFSVFRGAATLSFEPQGWLPPKGLEIKLEFPSCGWVTWCPSFQRAFR